MKPFICPHCNLAYRWKDNLKRHISNKHDDILQPILGSPLSIQNVYQPPPNFPTKPMMISSEERGPYDIRLKSNFKLFINGPSGSGKTFFISDLLKNLDVFAKDPPKVVVYVYDVWQPKYEEMPVHYFIKDEGNLEQQLFSVANGQPTLIVFRFDSVCYRISTIWGSLSQNIYCHAFTTETLTAKIGTNVTEYISSRFYY